jgi:hypothetical protein
MSKYSPCAARNRNASDGDAVKPPRFAKGHGERLLGTKRNPIISVLRSFQRGAKPPNGNWSIAMFGNGGPRRANKRPKSDDVDSKLSQVEMLMEQGVFRLDAIRRIVVFKQALCRWQTHYDVMNVDQLKEVKPFQYLGPHNLMSYLPSALEAVVPM